MYFSLSKIGSRLFQVPAYDHVGFVRVSLNNLSHSTGEIIKMSVCCCENCTCRSSSCYL